MSSHRGSCAFLPRHSGAALPPLQSQGDRIWRLANAWPRGCPGLSFSCLTTGVQSKSGRPHCLSYRRILVTGGSGGSGLSLRSDDLDTVCELYAEDEFRQLVVAVEAAPTGLLGILGELEDHRQRRLVR